MRLDLRGKVVCIFGLRGTGKSVWANHLLAGAGKQAFAWDPLDDHPQHRPRYRPSYMDYSERSLAEFNMVVRRAVVRRRSSGYAEAEGRVAYLVVDEADTIAPHLKPMPEALRSILHYGRHFPTPRGMGMGLIVVARRPVNLSPDLPEMADYLIIFRLTGRNDQRWCEEVARGLGETVEALPPYHWVLVHPDRHYQVMAPLPGPSQTPS